MLRARLTLIPEERGATKIFEPKNNEDETQQDITQKYVIVRKLLDYTREHKNLPPQTDLLLYLQNLTGVPKTWFQRFKPKTEFKRTTNLQIHKKYLKYLKFTQASGPLRSLMVKFYIEYSIVPVLSDLRAAFAMNYRDLHEMLIGAGYRWKRLQNTPKCILVEDYKHTFKRRNYLNAIIGFRAEEKTFVYVHRFINNINSAVFVARETRCLYLEYPSLKKLDKDINSIFNVCNPATTVFVINEHPLDTLHLNGVPTGDATRYEMTTWLDKNNIPYTSDMLRLELYKLIESFKHNLPPPKPAIRLLLESKGYTVLMQPMGFYELSIFDKASLLFRKGGHFEVTGEFIRNLKMYNLDQWDAFEKKLIAAEKSILEEDIKLEEIWDSILTMVRYAPPYEDYRELQHADTIIKDCDNPIPGFSLVTK